MAVALMDSGDVFASQVWVKGGPWELPERNMLMICDDKIVMIFDDD